MTRKPDGFYSGMTREEWLTYGREKGLDKLSRGELQKKEMGYYRKGRVEGWIPELIPKTIRKPKGFYSSMTKEEWLDYGREHGFDELGRHKLGKKEVGYYNKGRVEGWINELIPRIKEQKPYRFYSSMTKEEWLDYGIENGLDKLNRTELSKKEMGYYRKGRKEGWLARLIPKTIKKPTGFFSNMNKEQWFAYGTKKGLDKLSRNELRKKESRYYSKGLEENWLDELIPKAKEQKPNGFYSNMTKEEWLDYGRKNGFDKLNRTELSKKEKGYYRKGRVEGWLTELILGARERKPRGFFSGMAREEWLAYGRKNNLDKLKRRELSEKESRYYIKGVKEGWLAELIPNIERQGNGMKQVLDNMLNDYTK